MESYIVVGVVFFIIGLLSKDKLVELTIDRNKNKSVIYIQNGKNIKE